MLFRFRLVRNELCNALVNGALLILGLLGLLLLALDGSNELLLIVLFRRVVHLYTLFQLCVIGVISCFKVLLTNTRYLPGLIFCRCFDVRKHLFELFLLGLLGLLLQLCLLGL